jgi:hypothetical protein
MAHFAVQECKDGGDCKDRKKPKCDNGVCKKPVKQC